MLVEALSRGLPGDRIVADPDVLAAHVARRGRVGARPGRPPRCARPVRGRGAARRPDLCRAGGTHRAARRRHRPVRRRQRGRRLRHPRPVADEPGPARSTRTTWSPWCSPASINNDLKAAVAEHGLWYPPDPASAPWSTIGGNVATNAGGLCCLKYGVTRDYVLGLRAVVGGPVAYGDAGAPRAAHHQRRRRARPGRALRRFRGHARRGDRGDAAAAAGAGRPAADRRRPPSATWSRPGRAVAQITRRGLTPPSWNCSTGPAWRRSRTGSTWASRPTPTALLLARVDTPGDSGRGRGRSAIAAAMTDAGRDLGRAVDRRRRGRGAVRGPAAGLPGARAARPGPHRGRLRAAVDRCPGCWHGSPRSRRDTG